MADDQPLQTRLADRMPSAPTPEPPEPLSRGLIMLPLEAGSPGLKVVNVTTWGSPANEARVHLFYFGGMPSSAEEPALHSMMAGKADIFKEKDVHCVCIDKPGMGLTPYCSDFSIRRDWPRTVARVADALSIQRYGVFGMSNGGPYVMACLTTPVEEDRKRVVAAAMIVVSTEKKSAHHNTPSELQTFFKS
jgi:pimeloyl-ACP methyl ester carboxylesterase